MCARFFYHLHRSVWLDLLPFLTLFTVLNNFKKIWHYFCLTKSRHRLLFSSTQNENSFTFSMFTETMSNVQRLTFVQRLWWLICLRFVVSGTCGGVCFYCVHNTQWHNWYKQPPRAVFTHTENHRSFSRFLSPSVIFTSLMHRIQCICLSFEMGYAFAKLNICVTMCCFFLRTLILTYSFKFF